jgi:predicted dehydrogenase
MITCLARFGGEDGDVLGLLDVNWLTPQPRRELTLVGEHGMLRADYVAQTCEVISQAGTECNVELLPVIPDEPLLAELRGFARCILDDTPEPVPAHEGVRALAAALAVRESATAHRPVTLLDIPAPVPALEVAA